MNPLLSPKNPFQPLKELAPVSKVSSSPLVVAVNPGARRGDLGELIQLAKKHPGKLNYASSGNGSAPHMAAVLFIRLAGVDIVHVPFKGGAPAVQSVLAGDTQLSFATPPSVLPLVQAGRLRALAVTSRERTPLVPGVPGMAEAGLPDYEISFWYGSSCLPGTPAEVTRRLYAATSEALRAPSVGPDACARRDRNFGLGLAGRLCRVPRARTRSCGRAWSRNPARRPTSSGLAAEDRVHVAAALHAGDIELFGELLARCSAAGRSRRLALLAVYAASVMSRISSMPRSDRATS